MCEVPNLLFLSLRALHSKQSVYRCELWLLTELCPFWMNQQPLNPVESHDPEGRGSTLGTFAPQELRGNFTGRPLWCASPQQLRINRNSWRRERVLPWEGRVRGKFLYKSLPPAFTRNCCSGNTAIVSRDLHQCCPHWEVLLLSPSPMGVHQKFHSKLIIDSWHYVRWFHTRGIHYAQDVLRKWLHVLAWLSLSSDELLLYKLYMTSLLTPV